MALPFDRFLNLTYYWATYQGDEQAIAKFDARINRPPAEVRAKAVTPGLTRARQMVSGPWTAEAETASLSGLAAALGKRG